VATFVWTVWRLQHRATDFRRMGAGPFQDRATEMPRPTFGALSGRSMALPSEWLCRHRESNGIVLAPEDGYGAYLPRSVNATDL